MVKRLFDIVFSLIGLLILFPFLLLIAILVITDSRGGFFYFQRRVGKNNVDFSLLKFRTMKTGAEKQGLLTVGSKDSRITRIGYYLRKYKLDELPQLLNVLLGDMSLVGPRPEVRKYVDMYTKEQQHVLSVRPGITDYASIAFSNESELLGKSADPEKFYIEEVMPQKLNLNLVYIKNKSVFKDIGIIFQTIIKIAS
jgi:lipopolysaccharide/colanic/teichoic acid biosynthesis glycosyltransferase